MSKTRTFEDVLDECLGRLLVENQTLEQCLQSFPQHSKELKPILETALAAEKMPATQPRAEFKERARQQFRSALQETGLQKSRTSVNWGWLWQRSWATAVTIVLVILLAGGGTVYAASGSMPDNPLYPVKVATEQVELALTFSELGKAEIHARLADERITEIVYLAEADKPEKIALITGMMNTQLGKITALVSTPAMLSSAAVAPTLEQVAKTDEAPELKQTTIAAEAPTTTPAPTLTAPLPPQAAAAENASGQKSKEQPAPEIALSPSRAEETDKEGSSKDDKRTKLKTIVESQSNSNAARLRALLQTAPESAKPALQRALDLSEAEYKKAIEALK